ncbi:MAG: 2-oxo-4-hydroxy-4-carboxy-5-ureidoimidazoline decarboxylase [Aeromicrobium sp.]|uniref:2-oxo-4-hydroxy-4-carboxy-5-ureidoimidazoline decarboxylase n=1 Tax=Aeromicrobium sp. TaxID=1871063 RepID=UPI0039E30105
MRIDEFDTAPADTARTLLRPCADVPSWVDALTAERPFGSVDALLARADELARSWGADELSAALAHHPRIGERPSGDTADAELSRGEQASLGDADADVDAAIALGNAAYEEHFGRVFLIRAAGRTRPEVLAELRRRLDLDPADELACAVDQLRQIALLRIEGTFA